MASKTKTSTRTPARPAKAGYIDPAAIRGQLLIDTPAGPARLADVIEPYQAGDFAATDPAWRRIMGQAVPEAKMRAWLSRPRGHSKTTDTAVNCMAAMAGSPRTLSLVWAASDLEQAKLGRDAIDVLVRHNPILSTVLDVQQYRVVNRVTGSTLDFLSSDVGGSFGITPDAVVIDEIVWHRGRGLFDSLLSSAAKRGENCLLSVISTAGFEDSWQYELWQAVQGDPRWHVSHIDGPRAARITPAVLAEQEKLLPRLAYEQYWLNRWQPGSGTALDPQVIAAAFARGVPYMLRGESGWSYAAGGDLSVTRDFSAVAVIGKRGGRYRLARYWQWVPPRGGRIDQDEVKAAILEAHKLFNLQRVRIDDFQAEGLVQSLRKTSPGLNIDTQRQTGTVLVEQCMMLVETFNSGMIDLPPDALVERQIRRARVEPRPYGMRLVTDRTTIDGHSDVLSAICVGLVAAKLLPEGMTSWGGCIDSRPRNSWGSLTTPRLGAGAFDAF